MAESGDELVVWVIYDRPRDFPIGYVVRPWVTKAGIIHAGMCVRTRTLEEARALIPPGLFRLDRAPDDDPAILETWF